MSGAASALRLLKVCSHRPADINELRGKTRHDPAAVCHELGKLDDVHNE
jgi:hypothetical protein